LIGGKILAVVSLFGTYFYRKNNIWYILSILQTFHNVLGICSVHNKVRVKYMDNVVQFNSFNWILYFSTNT
jgi:hypothetical protein